MRPRPIDAIEADLRAMACSDGGCAVLRPRGMATNGGCRCVRRMLDEPNPHVRIQRVMHLQQERAAALHEATGVPALARCVRDLAQALGAKRTNDGDRLRLAEAQSALQGVGRLGR